MDRTTVIHTPAQASADRQLWLLVALAGVIISLCMGLRQSLGLFNRPMTMALGMPAASFGFAIALQSLVWGLAQPFVGAAADRFGPRPVLVATSLLFAAGLLLMAGAGGFSSALTLASLLLGVGVAGTGFGVLVGTVSQAAPAAQRTKLVALVAAAGSLGTMVMAPLGQALMNRHGWQAALAGFAAIAATMALFSIPIGGRTAGATASAAARQGGAAAAVRRAFAHRGYVFMALAFFACGFQLTFITTHLPAYLDLCGVAPSVGATALALIGLFNAVGTYAFGSLASRFSARHLLALIYLLRTVFIAAFLVLPVSPASTLVFAAAMGLLWLGVIPLVSALLGRMFGLAHFNTLNGIVFLSHQLGAFVGAWLGGVLFDRLGNYNLAWVALIAVGAMAFVLQWTMDEREPGRAV